MALTYTPAPVIGQPCPQFSLPGVGGNTYSLESFAAAKVLAIMFLCNHCPYVKAVEQRLLDLARELQPMGVGFVAICANDATRYPQDSFANLRRNWLEKHYPFPYLHDAEQIVAHRFAAVCTPDFFVYDEARKLAYRGRLDDNWQEPDKVQQQEMRRAILEILAGQPVSGEQIPSMGCSIKWID